MTNSEARARRYPDAGALAFDLAARVADLLEAALTARGRASLVVSGGRTPLGLFARLRTQEIAWARVCIALADERWVGPADEASNERQVREVLLRERAAAASFLGLKNAAPTPDAGAVAAWETFARVPRPFDVTLLGMGDDGHTASLFPGSPNLGRALDTGAAAGCAGMWAPGPPQARLSLNLSALLDSRRIVLLISGDAKWRTYQAACEPGPAGEMPVRGILHQDRVPVEVCWSP